MKKILRSLFIIPASLITLMMLQGLALAKTHLTEPVVSDLTYEDASELLDALKTEDVAVLRQSNSNVWTMTRATFTTDDVTAMLGSKYVFVVELNPSEELSSEFGERGLLPSFLIVLMDVELTSSQAPHIIDAIVKSVISADNLRSSFFGKIGTSAMFEVLLPAIAEIFGVAEYETPFNGLVPEYEFSGYDPALHSQAEKEAGMIVALAIETVFHEGGIFQIIDIIKEVIEANDVIEDIFEGDAQTYVLVSNLGTYKEAPAHHSSFLDEFPALIEMIALTTEGGVHEPDKPLRNLIGFALSAYMGASSLAGDLAGSLILESIAPVYAQLYGIAEYECTIDGLRPNFELMGDDPDSYSFLETLNGKLLALIQELVLGEAGALGLIETIEGIPMGLIEKYLGIPIDLNSFLDFNRR